MSAMSGVQKTRHAYVCIANRTWLENHLTGQGHNECPEWEHEWRARDEHHEALHAMIDEPLRRKP